MYSIKLDDSSAFKRDWKRMNQDYIVKKKIKLVLQKFSLDPFSEKWNTKKMIPKSDNKYRLRIGDYRVIYSIDVGNKIILVHRIGMRKDIYR